MKTDKTCSPQNYSVLIPYKDLENFMESANKLQFMEHQIKRMEKRIDGLQLLYSDLLEKVAELDRCL